MKKYIGKTTETMGDTLLVCFEHDHDDNGTWPALRHHGAVKLWTGVNQEMLDQYWEEPSIRVEDV